MKLTDYLKLWGDDFGFVPSKPQQELAGVAGSFERREALRERYELGLQIWNTEDEGVISRYCEDYRFVVSTEGRSAEVRSVCGRYLYRKWRYWGPSNGAICFIGLRPSELQWRRQMSLAHRLGYTGVESVNLYSWTLDMEPYDGVSTVGDLTDWSIATAVMAASKTCFVWGDEDLRSPGVAKAVLNRVGHSGICVLGFSESGHPLPLRRGSAEVSSISLEFFQDDGDDGADNAE